jgi:hypothetical protein
VNNGRAHLHRGCRSRKKRRKFGGMVSHPPHVRLIRATKRHLVEPGRVPRRVKGGPQRGLVMLLDRQHDLQRELGLHEVEVHRVLRRFAEPGVVALDIGCADGYETLALAKGGATVHSYDPDSAAMGLLRANLALNSGLADRILLHEEAFPSATVPAASFAKVDIDGGERGVLDYLLGVPVILVETHALELERSCAAFLREHGYTTRIIPNARWRRLYPEQRPIPHNRWLLAERT